MTAFAMLAYEMRATKQAKMLGNCRTGDGEGLGNFSGGLVASAKKVQDGAAGGVSEGLEGRF